MSRSRRLIKPVLSAVIVSCTGFFFYRAFQRNWATVRAHDFRISPVFLICSALAVVATSLVATWAWYTAMNGLSRSRIGFKQSVAAVNASSLTKYIPGKVWSYALQMYWLDGLGFSKALIVYVNLLNLLLSLGMSLIVGLVCLIVSHSGIPRPLLFAALGALVALDACCVLFNRKILNALVALVNRLFKRSFSFFEIERSLLVKLHSMHLFAAVTSGLGAYSFCFAIGYYIDFDRALLIIGASLVADVAGFLAIVVPGGLGVRESLMYAMLGGQATGSLSLVVPVASRLLSMAVDILLGAVALKLLQSLSASKRAASSASET